MANEFSRGVCQWYRLLQQVVAEFLDAKDSEILLDSASLKLASKDNGQASLFVRRNNWNKYVCILIVIIDVGSSIV